MIPVGSLGVRSRFGSLLTLESGPFQVLDDCNPGVDDCGCIASNRLDAVPIAFRYLPGHRPRRSAPGMEHSPAVGGFALQRLCDGALTERRLTEGRRERRTVRRKI